jgi:hypothetical protein
LTYEDFDETCSDVDCIGVTRRDLDDREFSELDEWFKNKGENNRENNRWVKRIDMRLSWTMSFLTRVRDAAASTTTPVNSSAMDRMEPHHLDEYREVRHHAVGPGREDDRAASVTPVPH